MALFGLSQPTQEGIEWVIEDVREKFKNAERLTWINLRYESQMTLHVLYRCKLKVFVTLLDLQRGTSDLYQWSSVCLEARGRRTSKFEVLRVSSSPQRAIKSAAYVAIKSVVQLMGFVSD